MIRAYLINVTYVVSYRMKPERRKRYQSYRVEEVVNLVPEPSSYSEIEAKRKRKRRRTMSLKMNQI